jgi:hypothetical protein
MLNVRSVISRCVWYLLECKTINLCSVEIVVAYLRGPGIVQSGSVRHGDRGDVTSVEKLNRIPFHFVNYKDTLEIRMLVAKSHYQSLTVNG